MMRARACATGALWPHSLACTLHGPHRPCPAAHRLSAMQGWRSHMEDDHVQLLSLSPDLPHLSLFGVYDGHGGEMVAHYMAKHFPDHLLATNKLTPDQSKVEAQAKDAFEAALMSIDAELRALPDVESGKDQSGSTAVMTLLSPTHVVCSNTGDSRAVLSRGGEAVALSDDHKPDNAIEKERVMAAGGEVKFGRVNGDLAVSCARWSHMRGQSAAGRPSPTWFTPAGPTGRPVASGRLTPSRPWRPKQASPACAGAPSATLCTSGARRSPRSGRP